MIDCCLTSSEHYFCCNQGYWIQGHFQQYFSYIVAVSFIGGGSQSIQRKPPTYCKSLTNFKRQQLWKEIQNKNPDNIEIISIHCTINNFSNARIKQFINVQNLLKFFLIHFQVLLKGNQQRKNEMQGTAIKLFYFISKREQYVTFNAM